MIATRLAVPLSAVCLLLASCAGAPIPDGLGVVPDQSVRDWLSYLSPASSGQCALRTRGARTTAWCRSYRDRDDHPIVAVHDPVTDELLCVLAVDPDGHQTTLWSRTSTRPGVTSDTAISL